ncbi:hypothetical protein [Halosegnis longus]|uniref:hypothetical protein n=1 Tax=Halosegnis longus TaxID=2216012 RepID=UPI001EF1062C|nr:hypothetical protein [Halosegnis longus]
MVDWFSKRAEEALRTRVSRFDSRLGLDDVPVWVGEIDDRWVSTTMKRFVSVGG